MARKTKAERELESRFDAMFSKHCSNIQFDMMDLNKMHDEWNTLVAAGKTDVQAIEEVREKYRKN